MSQYQFRKGFNSNELKFGFLPSLVIENLESDNLQTRIRQMSDLITTVQTTDPNHINVDQFTDYITTFFSDKSSIISEKSPQVILSLCHNLHSNIALYKTHFLSIIISNLSSTNFSIVQFNESLFHLMMTNISPQNVLLDLFSLTLDSSSETISLLLNLIAKEIQHSDIDVAFFHKFSFLFEDSFNSQNDQLIESAKKCLQAIKNKDILTYSKIVKNVNANLQSHTKANRSAQYFDGSFPSHKKIIQYNSINSKQRINLRNKTYAPPRPLKLNQTQYLSQETFVPSSRFNDRQEPTSTRSLVFDESHIQGLQPLHSATSHSAQRDNSLFQLSNQPTFKLTKEKEGENKRLLKLSNLSLNQHQETISTESEFQNLLGQMHSNNFNQQNESIQQFHSKIPIFLSLIISNLREVCSTLLDCANNHYQSQELIVKNALNALQSLIEHESVNVSPLAEYIAISLFSLYSSDNEFISEISSNCLISLIKNIQPQKAIDVLDYESRVANEKSRTKVAELFGIMAGAIRVYTQALVCLAQLAIDESKCVSNAAKVSLFKISQTCENFHQIVYQFVSEQQVRDIILNAIE